MCQQKHIFQNAQTYILLFSAHFRPMFKHVFKCFGEQSQFYEGTQVTTQEGDSAYFRLRRCVSVTRHRRVATETGRAKRVGVVSIEAESIDVLGRAVLVFASQTKARHSCFFFLQGFQDHK